MGHDAVVARDAVGYARAICDAARENTRDERGAVAVGHSMGGAAIAQAANSSPLYCSRQAEN